MNIERNMSEAVQTTLAAVFFSMELSRSKWLVTCLAPGNGERMSKHVIVAGDAAGLFELLDRIRDKARLRTGNHYPLVSIQEAGLDGFWIHRILEKEGIESYVVDPASISTPRRRRRAKTDRLDGEILLRTLLAFKRGDPRVCSMVVVPSREEEDRRRISRERRALVNERVALVNRIKGLFYSQGIFGFEPLKCDRRTRFAAIVDEHRQRMGPHLQAEAERVLGRIELIIEQIKALEKTRDSLAQPTPEIATEPGVANLRMLRGVGPDFAETLWAEGLYRHFDNRRQLAAYAGLAPTPWQSGTVNHEQGISKAGNPRLRSIMVQLSWFWLLHQPDSALSRWFQDRVKKDNGRRKKVAIVALARKLLIALWKFVRHGVVIEGAVLKPAKA